MTNTQPCPADVKATETGIIVNAEAGFCEAWNGEDCLGYVKGPGEKTFALKPGKHEIVIYCAGGSSCGKPSPWARNRSLTLLRRNRRINRHDPGSAESAQGAAGAVGG